MNVSVARVFFKPSDIGKEPSEAFLNTVESPATVELGLCFLLLILSSTTLSSLRWNCVCSRGGWSGLPRIGLYSHCCDSHEKRVLTRSDCADLDADFFLPFFC